MWVLFLLACGSSSEPVNTPKQLAEEFIAGLSDVDKLKSLFPSDEQAKELLACDGENQILRDKQRIFKKLDANRDKFMGIQTKFKEIKYIETKNFAKGLALQNCTFQENVESRKYLVTASLIDSEGESTDKTKRIIVIKIKSKWYLMDM